MVGVAVKVTLVPAQIGPDVLAEMFTLAGLKGLTVTFRVADVVPHRPAAVAVMVAVPEKPASQFMAPVEEFIEPAPAGETL
ncbi:hypothetical protein GCM10027293_24140 [Pontibacter aydingkolensis]